MKVHWVTGRTEWLTLPVGRYCVSKLHPWHPPPSQHSSRCGLRLPGLERLGIGLGTGFLGAHGLPATLAAATVSQSRPPPLAPLCTSPSSPPGQNWNPAAGSAAAGWRYGWWYDGTGLCRCTGLALPLLANRIYPGPVCHLGCVSECQEEAQGCWRRSSPGEPSQEVGWPPGLPDTVTWSVWSCCVSGRFGSCSGLWRLLSAGPSARSPQPTGRRIRRSKEAQSAPAGWPCNESLHTARAQACIGQKMWY